MTIKLNDEHHQVCLIGLGKANLTKFRIQITDVIGMKKNPLWSKTIKQI